MNRRKLKFWLLLTCLGAGAACAPEGCCAPPSQVGTGIHVINATVRACDLLFEASGDEVPSVTFGPTVRGEFVPKAPNVGVAFVAAADASLEGQELGRLVFTTAGQTATLVTSTCFDANGAPVPGDVVRISE
jgi:hypothetical protein